MGKLVNESKLIYFAGISSEKDVVVEMKLGKRYKIEIYAGKRGNVVCKFISELKSITIYDGLLNKEDCPDGFITELAFKNGMTIYQPQYDHDAVNICESYEYISK